MAIAFDDDASLTDLERLYIAQTGSTIVLKGEIPSQDLLDHAVNIAEGVSGASSVDTDAVTVG